MEKNTLEQPNSSDASQFSEMTLEELAKVLELTIKHDNENKIITFLCMLSAYTETSQINVSFNAQSSSGKTYTVTEIAKLFPDEDKIELSGASPTSFFYGESKVDKKRKAKIVSLGRKILILSEQSNSLLQAKLRPLLSHDKFELNFRMTNKDKKGANRAELIILEGFPATVFCSASMQLDEQETTRAILLSPSVSEDKLRAGVHLQALRGADEAKYAAELEANPERTELKRRILAIKQEKVGDIIISDPTLIEEHFHLMFPELKPRNMRDMAHLMQLIKAIALLNFWFRQQPGGTIVATQYDIDEAFRLWEGLAESQNMNMPPSVMHFYKEYVLPAYNEKSCIGEFWQDIRAGEIGVSRQEVETYYLRKKNSTLNSDWLRKQVLPQLENGGLIDQRKPEVGDRRSTHIFPKWFPDGDDPTKRNNTGRGVRTEGIDPKVYNMFLGGK